MVGKIWYAGQRGSIITKYLRAGGRGKVCRRRFWRFMAGGRPSFFSAQVSCHLYHVCMGSFSRAEDDEIWY